ncbi:unnamed protein product [Boreogadus saida]
MMEQQQQMQAHMERERRSSNSGVTRAVLAVALPRDACAPHSEDSSNSNVAQSNKNDANRTSGGGGGGLMEEMNALLARRMTQILPHPVPEARIPQMVRRSLGTGPTQQNDHHWCQVLGVVVLVEVVLDGVRLSDDDVYSVLSNGFPVLQGTTGREQQ